MRIAQVAPLWEQVPPFGYGGTELVVSLLTEELVRRGHQVTLFAAGDSETIARLEPGCEKALRVVGMLPPEYVRHEQRQLGKVFDRAGEFDLIHSHMDVAALPYTHASQTPVVHTLHGPFTTATESLFSQYRRQNLVTVSNSQQRPELGLNYVATVYNAISLDQFEFYPQPAAPPYLAFLGRMAEEKGPHLAIEIAKRSGWPLKMAGKIDLEDQAFFDRAVAPHIDGKHIEYLGEVNHHQKQTLMGQAIATLFPITWPEPFGLVMIESMASGTPVIAMAMGSAPEVVADGKTGFLCRRAEDCVEAVAQVHRLSRPACRAHVVHNFSVARMVDGYEAIYRRLISDRRLGPQIPTSLDSPLQIAAEDCLTSEAV
ncbi:MAG: glycosyltransferase family 4 protein [Cyanobacteria bacterium]|nr:glycosyltransferase family 4 protein [Cyanobacteriota bacterium]MDA0866502.1 glycosyltransferase family 4 protein [Cyanobacteriota bacterium]